MKGKIKIIGIGNILYGDDGLGPLMIEKMRSLKLPQDPELIRGETDSWYSLEEALTAHRLIIIDAVRGGKEPGSLYVLTLSDLAADQRKISPHCQSLLDLLFLYRKERTPKGWLVGIEPRCLSWGRGLSPLVAGRMDLLLKTVGRLLLSIPAPAAAVPETAGRRREGGFCY